MDFYAEVARLGARTFSLAEVLVAAGLLGLLLLLVLLVLSWRAGAKRRMEALESQKKTEALENKLSEMAGQLRQFAEAASTRDAHMSQRLDDRLDQVSHRLGQGLSETTQRTGKQLRELHERLAVIDTAQANITALSSEMLTLKDILSNKQARGAFGQARMEAIIRDGLHASAYAFQATLSNGTRPDCLIKLPQSDVQIVIDAKFPLEAFNALKAAEDEQAARTAEQRLRTDVLKHIRDISQKYLIKGETHETAILFVPSESIYADLYEHFEDIIQKAHRAQVIVASPNILMLMVQTMQAIFKDARMREQAHVIQKEVVHLLQDTERLRTRVIDLQRHFGQASGDIEKLVISSDKITKRGLRIEQMDLDEPDQASAAALSDTVKPKLVAGK